MKPNRFLLIILVIFGVLTAILVPHINRSIRNAQTTACASNLRSLVQASMHYTIRHQPPYVFPSDFLDLQKGPKPVITRYEVFFCPLSGEQVRPGYCSYLGPFKGICLADGREIMAAERPGNHGPGEGGNVITKTGDIFYAPASDPVWRILPVRP
jgi:hypothetical protein